MAASSVGVHIFKRVPVIVVIGATGTGKSKLALEIALKYGGQVISADSMQIYQGLDIITNKVTPAERDLVRHHLIDCASPLARWTVLDFRRRALPIIDNLLSSGQFPVVVGGTNYYIESLLWKILIENSDAQSDDENDTHLSLYERDKYHVEQQQKQQEAGNGKSDDPAEGLVFTQDGLDEVSTDRLHDLLRRIDPEMAEELHPNNRRKIIRSLQAWQQTGRPHSELLKAQRRQQGGSALGGPLRYADTLIFWVQCRQEVLDRRLDDRVDDMMERGLLTELADFHEAYNADRLRRNNEPDYTKGLFQSIGFKEFHEYLVLPSVEQRQQLLDQGVDALKTATRRYARKQIKWINHRFLMQPDRQVPPVYGLDATDVMQWDSLVRDVAFNVIDGFIHGVDEKERPQPLPVGAARREPQTSYRCDVCGKVMIGQRQWLIHLGSNGHRKRLKKNSAATTPTISSA